MAFFLFCWKPKPIFQFEASRVVTFLIPTYTWWYCYALEECEFKERNEIAQNWNLLVSGWAISPISFHNFDHFYCSRVWLRIVRGNFTLTSSGKGSQSPNGVAHFYLRTRNDKFHREKLVSFIDRIRTSLNNAFFFVQFSSGIENHKYSITNDIQFMISLG